MAPTKPVAEHKIDRTPEYEKFIEELRAFHEKRGTHFDPEPKMGNSNVDLLQLFNYIVEHGGYDKVSEEKLMWRKMCDGLGLMRHNAPADAYTLKNIFYKQLAAYEIKTVHKKEPPPPEILELTTAKGGSLLTRTLENFQARAKAADKEESGDDGTPSRERRAEDTPTSSARASRGLREAPAPRVIFHPDTGSARQTRHASGQQAGSSGTPAAGSPAQAPSQSSHSHNNSSLGGYSQPQQRLERDRAPASYRESYSWPGPSANQDILNPAIAHYQLPQAQQMQLRIVDTPINNPEQFSKRERLRRQARQGPPSHAAYVRATLPPGTLDGPNIYERCLLSLRSGVPDEQAFALNHLVKISYERGDKYKFSQFSGLSEGLTEVALRAGSLFYDVDWVICSDPEVDELEDGELDGINGTVDILERIARLKPKIVHDTFQSAEFSDQLTLITEAVLTIRNMVMLPDNAWFMSDYPPLKDLLCILLQLPDLDLTVELRQFALDIAEQLTPFLVLSADDPLYKTLLARLDSSDRGIILTTLRAISRIAMNHATETNKLSGVPPSVLQHLMDWLLLNDDELMDACLDFLYQYTAIVANLDTLVQSTNMEHLVAQLVRLLSHGAKRGVREHIVSDASVRDDNEDNKHSDSVRPIPKDLLETLVAMEEPDRCFQWLRAFFEEDLESNVTQIAVWQAYNNAFLEPLKKMGRNMINAAEFIRNISTVYQSAGAQIIRESGPQGEVQRFIIRGIRPRRNPLNLDGRPYFQCRWMSLVGTANCTGWFTNPETMLEHILVDHLGATREETNHKFKNVSGDFICRWEHCHKYRSPVRLQLHQFAAHLKIHTVQEIPSQSALQDTKGTAADAQAPSSRSKRSKAQYIVPAKILHLTYEETASVRDERNPNAPPQAAGIPLSAVLILRNIARNIGKTDAEEALAKQRELRQDANSIASYKERLFLPVRGRLWEIFAENRILTKDLTQLFNLLQY